MLFQITNHTASTLEVSCQPGFSGGLQQYFVMEVFETLANNSQVLVTSNLTDEPTISVWGLLPDYNYIVSVKAVNARGESPPVYVGGKTEGFLQPLPRAVDESRLPMLYVIVGILVALMVFGALVTATLAVAKSRRNKMRAFATGSGSADTDAVSDEDDVDDLDDVVKIQHEVVAPLLNGRHLEVEDEDDDDGGFLKRAASVSRDSAERKVSFLDCTCHCRGNTRLNNFNSNGDVRNASAASTLRVPPGLPVERAFVRTFSIDKLRPICPVCNPRGTTPYPSDNYSLDEIQQSSARLMMMQQQHHNHDQHS
jgi:hypothetical protein